MSDRSIIDAETGNRKKKFEAKEQKLIFEMFRNSFEEAVENIGEMKEFRFALDGQTILLKFAGKALYPLLTQALNHLSSGSDTKTDLTFFIWDGLSTSRPLPVLIDVLSKCAYQAPWITPRGERSELYGISNGEILSALYGETILTSFNLAEKIGIYWASSAADVPYYEIGAPLRMPLSWHFSSLVRQILHSGAVGTANGGVLLAGKGGSGKSTTALSCLGSPLSYAGDDYLLVSIEEKKIIGHSLFNTAKVKSRADLARFAKLNLEIENSEKVQTENEKPMMFLNSQMPEKLISSMPLKAIVFPRFIAGETTRYIPVSQQSAFKSLVNSNVVQTPHLDKESMQMMSTLTKRLPAYLLVFGEKSEEIPYLIGKILAKNI